LIVEHLCPIVYKLLTSCTVILLCGLEPSLYWSIE